MSSSGNRFERHAVLTIVGIGVAIGLGGAVVSEAVLSVIGSRENSLLGPAPEGRVLTFREYPVGQRFWTRPLSEAHIYPGGLEDRRYWVEIDSNGFIVPSKVHDWAALDVVFLGGSTTECLFVDPDLRFPYLVGRVLEDSLGIPVNSYNGGRSGNVALHSVLAFLGKVAPMRVKYVVLMENINDLAVLTHYGSYWNESARSLFRDPEGGERGRPGPARYVKGGLRALLPNTYAALAGAWHALAGSEDEFAAVRNQPTPFDLPTAEREFRRSLETFVTLVRLWGGTPVLITQASRFSEQPDREVNDLFEYASREQEVPGLTYAEFRTRYVRFNDVVRQVAQELGVGLIDLDRLIDPDRTVMYDAVHYTDEGSRRVAAVISRSLLELERTGADGDSVHGPNRRLGNW